MGTPLRRTYAGQATTIGPTAPSAIGSRSHAACWRFPSQPWASFLTVNCGVRPALATPTP